MKTVPSKVLSWKLLKSCRNAAADRLNGPVAYLKPISNAFTVSASNCRLRASACAPACALPPPKLAKGSVGAFSAERSKLKPPALYPRE